ncbi:hypothetical protein BH11GEM2_BH11GEM2_28820 [soil metagenome]
MRVTPRVLALALVASAVTAQAQQTAPAPPPGAAQPRQGAPPQGRGVAPGGRRMARSPDGPADEMPGAPPMMRGPMAGGGIASMLLAHTAELKLTDQQLSKLAVIARRSDDRHKAMRASMDSLMRANRPQPDGMAPANPRPLNADQDRTMMTRMRDQEHADLRDALAVLTIDQQADAWMMRGAGPEGARGQPGARFSGVRARHGE